MSGTDRTTSGEGVGVVGVDIGTMLTGRSTVIFGLALTLGLSTLGISVTLGASNLGISMVGMPGLPLFVLVGWMTISILGVSIFTSVFGVLNVTSIFGIMILIGLRSFGITKGSVGLGSTLVTIGST